MCSMWVRVCSGFLVVASSAFFAVTAEAETSDVSRPCPSMAQFARNVLRAQGESRELLRDVRLVVSAGAKAEPMITSTLPVGAKGARVPVQTIEVDSGRVDAFFGDSKVGRGVLLQGPDKVLGISTGGHIAMLVSEATIVIAAIEGDALVGSESKFKPLESGKIRVFTRASKTTRDFPLPEKAELASDTGLAVAMTGGVDVDLRAVSEGPISLVLTDTCGAPVKPAVRRESGAKLSVSVPRAGIYYAFARRLGESDMEGPLSEPVRIQVLGLAEGQAPPVNEVFFLDHGERVRLAGTEGLEVRYGSSPHYAPAPSSIGLSRAKVTRVEFRDPKAKNNSAVVVLAPRVQRAEIEIGPAGAKWPGKPVTLRVGLWDGVGRLMTKKGDLDVRVTVNSKTVPVAWRDSEQGLLAQIAPQKGPGPWIVRVNVYDRAGKRLARDILEVAGH